MQAQVIPVRAAPPLRVELEIGGMTCASCAARIERKLSRLDGVTATVNYATEKVTLSHPVSVEVAALIAVVEATGYTARLPRRATPASEAPPCGDGTAAVAMRRRLLING